MSLSAREQQALDSITDRLAGSDPRLSALLTGFTRLVAGEEMPLREVVRAGSRRAVRCSRCKGRHLRGNDARGPAGRVSRRLGIEWAAVLLSLLAAVAVVAVSMALTHGRSQNPCTPFWTAACANSAAAHNSRSAPQGR